MVLEAKPYGPGGCYIDSSYSFIIPGLYVGGLASVSQLPCDIGHVDCLVLCAKELVELQPVDEALPDFTELLRCPLRDVENPEPELMELATATAREVAARIMTGKTVLVMCSEGVNRSGLVAALALLELGCRDPIGLLREQRHVSVLLNRAFEKLVREINEQ